MADKTQQGQGNTLATDEEEPQYHSRDSLRSATPIIVPPMNDSLRNLLATPSATRDATTPVVASSQGPEKLVPRAPTVVEEPPAEGEAAVELRHPQAFSRERRQTRSVRMGDKESSRYRQSKKQWAVVVGDFQGIYGDELTLKAGERVEIVSKDVRVSRNIGWWTGRSEKGRYGIFPEGCVKILNKTGENEEEANIEIEYPFIISCSDIQLKEAIGVGGFGRVHRAIYKKQEVAVKVAKSTTFDLVKAAQDVITEAQKFAHLAHVNVCALIGVVLVRDVCLVMEYAQGGALSEILHKKKVSLPLDVILDWSHQIASGMNYLHTEVKPSLIHRDLKSSNILLANAITPTSLYNNTIKITDFGLAREIEHTTQMTGAGTYPWMAPEVIISNDFSTKCDVWRQMLYQLSYPGSSAGWAKSHIKNHTTLKAKHLDLKISYGVVMWELLTGEKPYGNLNAFVVAYGVGRGTLSLPLPDSCPESFQSLMNACWQNEYSKRPAFSEILRQLRDIEREEFMTSTSFDDFASIQSTWKSEIQERFLKFKREESAFKEQELPGDIAKRIKQQEEKIQQQQHELEKLRKETKLAQEEWQRRRESEQEELFRRQSEELEKLKEKLREMEMKKVDNDGQQNRPPRVKRFSARRLLKWLSGSDAQKTQHKTQRRPNSGSNIQPVSMIDRSTTGPRRMTSYPSTSNPSTEFVRPASVAAEMSSRAAVVGKRSSLPHKHGQQKLSRHKRSHSGGNISKSDVEEYGLCQPSNPTYHRSSGVNLESHIRPFTEGMQKMIDQEVSGTRVRSLSHPRSPSPNILALGVLSPNSPKSPQCASTNSAAYSQTASVASEFDSIRKPSNLMLQNKHVSSDDSNPNSPMNPHDSGNTTGSDFSNYSVTSDPQQQSNQLINLDPSNEVKAPFNIGLTTFDPLYQMSTDETVQQISMRHTPSFDSLLMDPRGGTTSGNVSPNVYSTSPNLRRQTSPRSAAIKDPQPVKSSPIARPRPRPGKLPSYAGDTGPTTHRAFSPSRPHRKSDVSPSGSVQSLIVGGTMGGYDSDYSMSGCQSDSDATSTHSSLLDLGHDEKETDELPSPLMPTPASLDTLHFEFDLRKF